MRRAQSTEKHPETWLAEVMRNGSALTEDDALTPEGTGDEFLLMGLRLREGIDPAIYRTLAGRSFSPKRIDSLLADGLIALTRDGRIAATPEGALVLDAVVADRAA